MDIELIVTVVLSFGFLAGRLWGYWWDSDVRESRDHWKSYAEHIEKRKDTISNQCGELQAENESLKKWAASQATRSVSLALLQAENESLKKWAWNCPVKK